MKQEAADAYHDVMRAMTIERQMPVEERPLKHVETPAPLPKEDEVLLRVSACGVCRTDLHIAEGDLPLRVAPIVPGHQIVGVVEAVGDTVSEFTIGERAGVAWLGGTCGNCRFCVSRRENLCNQGEFTGWTRNGGFGEFVAARADAVYRLPDNFSDIQAAPLLCAGIIGYRALRLTGIDAWTGARLGIYGFGSAGHVCIQIARSRGAEVYVATRDRVKHQRLAEELGAAWVGDTYDSPGTKLDAAIVFAPAGEIVPAALGTLDKGSTLVLGGIHMSPIPQMTYDLIYGERIIRSVTNNTRQDGLDFLNEAAAIPIRTSVTTFRLNEANEALLEIKNDAVRGSAVLEIRP